jgi:hypothetical protein
VNAHLAPSVVIGENHYPFHGDRIVGEHDLNTVGFKIKFSSYERLDDWISSFELIYV